MSRCDVRLDTSLESLLERAPADRRQPRTLATVAASAGSTYRKPGARMLIMEDGSYLGLLSGGCLEADLAVHARQVMHEGVPRAIEYDMRGPDDILFGIGAGCEGAMRILLEPAGAESAAVIALQAAGAATARGEATTLVAVHESAALKLGTYHAGMPLPPSLQNLAQRALQASESQSLDLGSGAQRERCLAQYLAPPPHLLICGAGPDAEPVVAAARGLAWRVTVVDHRPAYAVAARFPGACVLRADAHELRSAVDLRACHAAVVMSHHLKTDATYLRQLAQAEAPPYVGLLGPEARRMKLSHELGADAEKLGSRIHGPVGLNIGATTPEAIALSIIGQVHASLAGR